MTSLTYFKNLKLVLRDLYCPLDKLVSMAMDGTPAMHSENVSVAGLLKARSKQLCQAISQKYIVFCFTRCCVASLQMNEVTDVIANMANFTVYAQMVSIRCNLDHFCPI